MDSAKKTAPMLDDVKIHVKLKLSALWVSAMLCYIYGDFFQLFTPRALARIIHIFEDNKSLLCYKHVD